MQSLVGELVTFQNARGLSLDGMVFHAENASATIVHVHGSFGNFYQNQYLRTMAKGYLVSGLNFLTLNLSAHDGVAEGYRNVDEFEYVGGAVTEFGDCVDDIGAAVKVAEQLTSRVVLQGHSLGCDRVLHYMLSSGHTHEFVLLCPCDSHELHEKWIEPETVDEQIIRLRAVRSDGQNLDWVPTKEYGIRQGEWTYPIPITRRALLSIIDGPPFQLIRPKVPAGFFIDARALVYLGGSDLLLTVPVPEMFSYFEKRVRTLRKVYVGDGDHMLSSCAEEVVEQIVKWVLGR